jgi:hypothetical protein
MCWSGEASAILGTIGLGGAAYAAYRKEPAPLWVSLGYFSLMELLQAFTYTVIDQCELPSNQVATLLGYIHITFQPFFVNAVSLYFVSEIVRRKVQTGVYMLCLASAVVMILQLYPFEWAGHCDPSRPLCAERLCSVRGSWHIAWEVPTNGLFNPDNFFLARAHGFPSYTLVVFILPLLYGAWRFTAYHWLMGPFLARQTTDNMNEFPAVWCLLSIALLLVAVDSPLRRYLYVRNWWGWPASWRSGATDEDPPANVGAARAGGGSA